ELLTDKKLFFQRSNPGKQLSLEDFLASNITNSFANKINGKDTLAEYIRSLAPISSSNEKTFADNQLKISDLERMQKYFLYFWEKRDNLFPEKAWQDYLTEVERVDREYGTRLYKGYETDRGRVYLQYGLPNSITKADHEPNSYPYEIWHYYKTVKKSNVKFVFIDTDLAINDYTLIHSDAIGEINDPRWHFQTQKRNTPFENIDIERGREHYGGRALEYFKNPR
ncbi:MAG: GWxTD domain-containing protein, partial [Deltaproteobacteria bacterium]|nr:GWxTD domain-containing protein [Deltaproteobacteria bacterium]